MRNSLLAVCLLLSLGSVARTIVPQEKVVFEGQPTSTAWVGPAVADRRSLTDDESKEFVVRIVENGGRYFWATRGMKELRRVVDEGFITYQAVDGRGYVRVRTAASASQVSAASQHTRPAVEYVEHLVMELGSITYYGRESWR
jgi:hypothetical protein